MNKRYGLMILLGVGAIGLALTGVGWLTKPATPLLAQAMQCDLNLGQCRASAQGKSISLAFSPTPVPLLKPLQLEARLTGFNAQPEQLQLVLEGLNMYMGMQRTWLKPNADFTQYQGVLQIPSCQEQNMQWKVTVLLPLDSELTGAEFFMQTHAP